MTICGCKFEGPYSIDTTVIPANRAAVYVIICKTSDGKYDFMDVGETGEIGIRITGHKRRFCWKFNCDDGSLSVYLHYMPSSEGYTDTDRRELESKIRNQHEVACGER